MIYRCKSCDGALEYSVEMGKMECAHCGNLYDVEEVSPIRQPREGEKTEDSLELLEARKHATIKMQVVRCTSCAARLVVNSVETSSFCAYCGQPAVVDDRMEDYLVPDYIIPFRKTKVDAKCAIRAWLSNAEFPPDEMIDYQLDKLRGIYVPFWLFDMHVHGKQYYSYGKKTAEKTVIRYEYLEAETDFQNMTVDGSWILNDNSSARLEPYDMSELEQFNPAYLAGFYSDRYDKGLDAASVLAQAKATELYNEEARRNLVHRGNILPDSQTIDYKVQNAKYALLPVWFLSFRHENTPYTILVNGQTGKVVGTVPFDKAKVIRSCVSLGLLMSIICAIVVTFLSRNIFTSNLRVGYNSRGIVALVLAVPFTINIIFRMGLNKYRALKNSLKYTTSKLTNSYANERQGK